MKELETLFTHNIFLYIHLNALTHPLQMGKPGLAHKPERDDAPRHAHFPLVGLQLGGGSRTELLHQGRGRIRPAELPRIRIMPQRLDLLELLAALLKLVARLKFQGKILSTAMAAEYSGPSLLRATNPVADRRSWNPFQQGNY